ncbi:MAG: hypothetical protein DWI22_22330 [Planctomycetota bacterium]|nr:MAG: hypothetical protein DWI22_22330 [Planctomycetota bacterium]
MAALLLDAAKITFLHERNPHSHIWRFQLDGLPCGVVMIDGSHKTGDFLKTVDTDGRDISRPHFPSDRKLVGHVQHGIFST